MAVQRGTHAPGQRPDVEAVYCLARGFGLVQEVAAGVALQHEPDVAADCNCQVGVLGGDCLREVLAGEANQLLEADVELR